MLFNACAIEVPDPDVAPSIFGADTVQLKVVPLTPLGLVILTLVMICVEQIVCVARDTAALGIGFTVTVGTAELEQPLAVAVTV